MDLTLEQELAMLVFYDAQVAYECAMADANAPIDDADHLYQRIMVAREELFTALLPDLAISEILSIFDSTDYPLVPLTGLSVSDGERYVVVFLTVGLLIEPQTAFIIWHPDGRPLSSDREDAINYLRSIGRPTGFLEYCHINELEAEEVS